MSDIDDLERLHTLHLNGALSYEEYDERKATILTSRNRSRRRWPLFLVAMIIVCAIVVILSTSDISTIGKGSNSNSTVQPNITVTSSSHELVTQPPEIPPKSRSALIAGEPDTFSEGHWPLVAGISDGLFARYPAPSFHGPKFLPRFKGNQAAFAEFKSEILSSAEHGPNFAGKYRLIQIGCGTHCTLNFILDEETGLVAPLQIGGKAGGEDGNIQDMRYYPTSRLLMTAESDTANAHLCNYVTYQWNGSRWRQLSSKPVTLPDDQTNELGGCAN